MNDQLAKSFKAAATKILRRLAHIALRSGVSFDEFMEMTKHTFVEAAEQDFPITGRKMSASRIATLTGIPRKEVARVQKADRVSDAEMTGKYNRAARVFNAWLREPLFTDGKGDPLDLPMEGTSGFSELVRRFGGDVPARAVADELIRVGALEVVDDRFRLSARGYVPSRGSAELFEILGTHTAELMETIDFNLRRGPHELPLLQQKVVYDNVPVEHVDAFLRFSRRMGESLIKELDFWLAEHDRDRRSDLSEAGRARLGLAVFQIREILETPNDGEKK